MSELTIRSLTNIPITTMHNAFTEAFSDYEVKLEMPLEKFREMILIRDIKSEYSIGCFYKKNLVGFILTGYREINGRKIAYDGGTGVKKDFRRKGIAEQLLKHLIDFLKEKKLDVFMLEVLENNKPAIRLYEKHGFIKTRRLECFEIEKYNFTAKFEDSYTIKNNKGISKEIDLDKYELYLPSWQNADKSIENNSKNYSFQAVELNGQIVCFGYIHKKRGDIPQIGILSEWKNNGIEKLLLFSLSAKTKSEKLLILNVEENNYLSKILQKEGFKNFVIQWEMKLDLK